MTQMTSSKSADGSTVVPMAIIGGMFFVFGFVTWLNGPLITFVKLAFTLDDVSAFLVPMAFYMSYFFLSLPASAILKRTGMKTGMALALLVMAVGAALFGQFVAWRYFPGALSALFIIGAGLSILQTASNPYISILGPIDSAAQRIAFMGICNKFAGILAPLVIGQLVLKGVGDLSAQVAAAATPAIREALLDGFAHKIYLPYLVMAGLLAVLAVAVARSPLPDITEQSNPDVTAGGKATSLFGHANLWLGFLCLFFYVGAEVMAGDAIGTYGNGFGLPLDQTKYFTSGTLVAMLVGYVAGLVLIPRVVSQARYLVFSAVLGVVFTVMAYLTRGYVSVAFVAALGFANAMMWPAIFPLGIKGLGRHTATGSAILIMGIAGGAVLPQLFAWLKGMYDFQLVFAALMVPAYLYILFFGLFAARRERAALR